MQYSIKSLRGKFSSSINRSSFTVFWSLIAFSCLMRVFQLFCYIAAVSRLLQLDSDIFNKTVLSASKSISYNLLSCWLLATWHDTAYFYCYISTEYLVLLSTY